MTTVLLVTYLLIVLALIAVILLQRSEGGGLGMGTASGGLISVRGSANLLTRTTAILATLFFATAIGLTILSEVDRSTRGILQQAADSVGTDTETPTNVLDALNQLQAQSEQPAGGGAAGTTPPAPTSDPALALPEATAPAPAESTAPAAPAATTPAAPAATTPAQPMTPAEPAPASTPAPAQ